MEGDRLTSRHYTSGICDDLTEEAPMCDIFDLIGGRQRGMTDAERNAHLNRMYGAQLYGGHLGAQAPWHPQMYQSQFAIKAKEKLTMEIYTEQIDKHLLVKVGCKKHLVHDKKELRKVMIELLDENLDTLWRGSSGTLPNQERQLAVDQRRATLKPE